MSDIEQTKGGERLMVAHLLESVDGQNFSKWPLHITLLPWFECQESLAVEAIESVTEHIKKCRLSLGEVALGSIEMFGENSDIPVRRVVGAEALSLLNIHRDLLDCFDDNLINKQYVGENYVPHISVSDEYYSGESDIINIDNMSLIKHCGQHKTIVRNYNLNDKTTS